MVASTLTFIAFGFFASSSFSNTEAFSTPASALPLAVFMGLKLAWGVPLALAVVEWRQGRLAVTWPVLAVIVCALVQLPFVTDPTRLVALAFVAVVAAAVELFRRLPLRRFRVLIGVVVLGNALIPQVFVVPQGLVRTTSLPVAVWLQAHGRDTFRGVDMVPFSRGPSR